MKLIRISDETNTLLREAAVYQFEQTGERQSDGWWLVPINEEVWQTIDLYRMDGETDNDVVQRLILTRPSRQAN